MFLPNVKEHAPLSARASVDHGVEVNTTGEHVNRAADRGCCVSSCSESSLMQLTEECCLSNTGEVANGFTIGMLKERLALLPSEWDSMYLTMQEVWNDDEKMRYLIPPDQYREKGTVNALQFYAHRNGVRQAVLGVKILEQDETHALLSSPQNTSASDNLASS